jgi:hypothetical protein
MSFSAPKSLWLAFGFFLLLTMAYQSQLSNTPKFQALSQPLTSLWPLFSQGDRAAFAYGHYLWLQQQDDQPGIHQPHQQLDYAQLTQWLVALHDFYPRSEYAQGLAVRVYTRVNDVARKKVMLDFVQQQFIKNPAQWRFFAEATVVAKHGLKDPRLALTYAKQLTQLGPADMPFWVKDLPLVLLEDLKEIDSAKLLIGAMLSSGTITDPYELNFLTQKLDALNKN